MLHAELFRIFNRAEILYPELFKFHLPHPSSGSPSSILISAQKIKITGNEIATFLVADALCKSRKALNEIARSRIVSLA